jgi:hypothetical protein
MLIFDFIIFGWQIQFSDPFLQTNLTFYGLLNSRNNYYILLISQQNSKFETGQRKIGGFDGFMIQEEKKKSIWCYNISYHQRGSLATSRLETM